MTEVEKYRITKDEIDKVIRGMCDKNQINGMKSGFPGIDELTGGFCKGDLIVVGGRPSMGKTAFGLSLVYNMAICENASILYVTLEMTKEKIIHRLLMMCVGMDILDAQEIDRTAMKKVLELAEADLLRGNIFICDNLDITVTSLDQLIGSLEKKPEIIIIDYLQLMAFGLNILSKDQYDSYLDITMQGLKKIGRKYECAIIALSQLSRKPDKRKNHIPLISDFHGAGIFLARADTILLLYRDEYYEHDSEYPGVAEVIVAKTRYLCGTVPLKFSRNKAGFENLSHYYMVL